MNKKLLTATIVVILVTTLQSGCARLLPAPAIESNEVPVTRLLFYSRALSMASPSGRLAMLASAKDTYAEDPAPEAAARLALAYGHPGYKGYAPENCRRYTQKALADENEYWGPAAIAFLHQFSALCADNDQVRDRLDETREKQQDVAQQLSQLQQALAQAKRKLQALTQIETKLSP